METAKKFPVRCGCSTLAPMTRAQAQRWGDRNIEPILKRAGFKAQVVKTCVDINGWEGYRIVWGK